MYYEKIDGVLPIELFNSLGDLHTGSKYGNKSSLDDDHGHWYKDFTNSLGSTCNLIDISTLLSGQALEIWKHLSGQEFFKNFVPVRFYVNSMSYGLDGYVHTDSVRENEVTAVIYLNDEWDPNFGGETLLFKDGEILYSCLPKPNRAFLFDARYKHVARGLSRKCTQLRKTLIIKLRKKRSILFERLSGFLLKQFLINEKNVFPNVLGTFQKSESIENVDYLSLAASLCAIKLDVKEIESEFSDLENIKITIDLISTYRLLDITKTFKYPIFSNPIITYKESNESKKISRGEFLDLKKMNDMIPSLGSIEIQPEAN